MVIINFNDHLAGFQVYLMDWLVVPRFEEVVSLTLKEPCALLTTSFLPGVPITDRSFSLSSKNSK